MNEPRYIVDQGGFTVATTNYLETAHVLAKAAEQEFPERGQATIFDRSQPVKKRVWFWNVTRFQEVQR